MTFDPRRICGALNDEGVRYVLVGGFAAAVHGSPLPTTDVDVLPAHDPDNLERLADALGALNAKIRTADGPVATTIDARFIAAMPEMLNLATDHGDVDILFAPAGPKQGHQDWDRSAVDVEIAGGLTVRVAALDDVIASKRAAGREKDERALPYLESLRDLRDLDY